MNETCVVPEWLHNIFLGYGNPSAAQWMNMPDLLEVIDFKDTFLDANHVQQSFPDYQVTFINSDGTKNLHPSPPFKIRVSKKMRESSHALPGNMNSNLTVKSRNNMADGEPQKEKLIVETYIPADPGPYPQDKPKQNSVRFTPTQIGAIISGIQPGLTMKMYEDASQVATDAVGSIRTVASFCAEKRVVAAYRDKCEALRKQGIRSGVVGGLGYGFSFLMLFFTYGLCFYVGAQFVRQGKTTFPDVFKVFFALVLAAIGVLQASALASDATKARDSAISIFSVLDRESKIDSSSGDGMTLEDVSGNIDFRNVSFKYPLRLDVQIFSDFTLRIPSGKAQLVLDPSDILALVGKSGSGKSTIIALLERLYDPDFGRISLDDVECTQMTNLTCSYWV
ncbi:Cullin-associated NEDD8-dissociated protein 1 [Zea mays]|uniref:Cullin-associated NEDD8-dissociated protein 1 n=1 Tax=Zea mays TaxID=4577 RepID=A0A1D6P4D5_MAIZE|nr:Cullin-associated NEDD8-dissociated protein 1 [Zea mays]